MLVADQWSRRRKTSEGMEILYDRTGRRKEEEGGKSQEEEEQSERRKADPEKLC
jgi:hypothetical protein